MAGFSRITACSNNHTAIWKGKSGSFVSSVPLLLSLHGKVHYIVQLEIFPSRIELSTLRYIKEKYVLQENL